MDMPSSKLDDIFVSLPTPGKIGIFLWTYLSVNGWFSTYMLIMKIDEAWRNEMFGTLIPEGAFVWIALVMLLTSMVVIGLLYYGRYTRKKKEVIKAAVAEAKQTGIWNDPGMKFDLAVIPFWIGASVLNVLFSMILMVVSLSLWDTGFEVDAFYFITGIGISFFLGIVVYVITEYLTNGVLDGKAVKSLISSIIGSPTTQKVVTIFCERVGIADQEIVDRIFEKVKDCIKAKEYDELTPDEVLLLNSMIAEIKKGVDKPTFLD